MEAPSREYSVDAHLMFPEQMGDRTNFVLMFAGELLKKAENLLTMGLHPSEIIAGYEMARDKAEEELKSQSPFCLLFWTNAAPD